MTGNLSAIYMLRVARIERARNRFRLGHIHESEFRDMLAADGMIDRSSQDAEIRDCLPGLDPIGEAAKRVIERIKP